MQFKLRSRSSSENDGQTAGGKGCLTVFFLIFFAMGSIFTVAILGEAVRVAAVWFWPEVPCTVISAEVNDNGGDQAPYTATVIFEYQIDGRNYRADKVAQNPSASASFDRARDTVDRYPPGSRTACRVHPDFPSEAVLERRLPFIALVVFLPLIFVAIGAGGIWVVWRSDAETTDGESISQRARKGRGKTIGLIVGIIFTAVGGIFSIFLFVLPMANLARASVWNETSATIVQSTLRSWSTDDGTSYRADVHYEYSIGSRIWRSNRRGFYPFNSGGSDGARAVLATCPEGRAVICFVNPDDPSQSILERRFRPIHLVGLFSLVFLIAGVALTSHSLGQRPQPEALAQGKPHEMEIEFPSRTLEPEAGPLTKVVGIFIFAAIWNGIVSVFLWQVVQSFQRGDPEWSLTVFLIPFVLVGLATIFGVFYFLLAMANPQPSLTITPGSPRLGSGLHVEWGFSGKAGRLVRLKIVIEGHEKATYQRGTDTHTDREAFASIVVIDTSSDWDFANGTRDVEIPVDTMHSFASNHNAVVWAVHVHGEIPRWPDVNDTFEIEVRPLTQEQVLP